MSKEITSGPPAWQTELWYYLRLGDGERCPLDVLCPPASRRVGCFNLEPPEKFQRIMSFVARDEIDPLQDAPENRPTAPGCLTRGKIFLMVTRLASEFREHYGVISLPETDGFIDFSNDLGVGIQYVPLADMHGIFWQDNGRWTVQLNDSDSAIRQTYTFYHYLFRILAYLGCGGNANRDSFTRGTFREALADHFAAQILAPPKLVKEKYKETKDLVQLAGYFSVPQPVMYFIMQMSGIDTGQPGRF